MLCSALSNLRPNGRVGWASATEMCSKVALFGLSANPPTGMGGHAGIVSWAALRPDWPELGGGPADQVWVLPVYQHSFEEKRQMASFEHRLAMAKLAFEQLPGLGGRVHVSALEQTLRLGTSEPLGTIDVVRHLRQAHPHTRFALLLGGDTHRDLLAGRWKESEALRALIPVVPIQRQGVGPQGVADGPQLLPISSSQLRATTDPALWAASVSPAVFDYVRAHHLYGF